MADISKVVVHQLRQHVEITSLVGSSTQFPTWVFAEKRHVNLEGTSKEMVVVSLRSGWAIPNRHNTMQFPRVLVQVFSDPTRTANKDIVTHDADPKANSVWEQINKVLHRVDGFAEVWGPAGDEVRVSGCFLGEHPEPFDVSDSDGQRLLQCHYHLTVG